MNTGMNRLRAAAVHLFLSGIIASAITALILLLWYPGQFAQVAKGLKLILLVVGVDIVMGPLLTFVVFNPKKCSRELLRDISVIAALQLCALAYGAHTVFVARPVALVFEGSNFRLVSALDVDLSELGAADSGFNALSYTGPVVLGTRDFKDAKEKSDSAFRAFEGSDIGSRPSFWQSYSLSRDKVIASAHALSVLRKKYPAQGDMIDQTLLQLGAAEAELRYVPLMARGSEWSVLVDASTAEVRGFIKLDGF